MDFCHLSMRITSFEEYHLFIINLSINKFIDAPACDLYGNIRFFFLIVPHVIYVFENIVTSNKNVIYRFLDIDMIFAGVFL